MANYTSSKKTLIVPGGASTKFRYKKGEGNIYINSSILRKNQGMNEITVDPINENFVIYFDSSVGVSMDSSNGDEFTYQPDSSNSDEIKKMSYKRLNMMIDDDTSYSLLRVNPKLTGNVKVVVDSESNMYLDTFKVSLGLSQNKYRHISINPSEYYGRTLMAKMKSMPVDDFYKIEDTCYDLFATANDFNEQYYDKYNYGVRTNTDKMYKENYSLLAPLCIRKVLPDFFLIFKINDYESLLQKIDQTLTISDRTKFINLNNCELVKSFDFREGTNLGTYVRNILEHNKSYVGDIYTGYDYDHFNIFNGISIDNGVVANIYEETSTERTINNQVSMNDWYTLGFQRNHIVSKDIINFEFMFDDTDNLLFSLPTYFGLYVRLNGEDETFTCIGGKSSTELIFDNTVHGGNFDPKNYPTVIYGVSTPDSFVRLSNNVKNDPVVEKHKLQIHQSIATVDTFDINEFTDNGSWRYVSNVLNDVLDPGEHYRLIIPEKWTIYEVICSNCFDDNELSDISHHEEEISYRSWNIYRISILNVEYRSNISESDKPEIIKKQLDLITKAFESFNDIDLKVYNDGESFFSLIYNNNIDEDTNPIFEKVSSICGFNDSNDVIIKDTTNEFVDKSSYLFGSEDIKKIVIDPRMNDFENSEVRLMYPIGFEELGTRACYCVLLKKIVYDTESNPIVLVSEDIQKSLNRYKTVLYKTYLNDNLIFGKNVNVNYLKIEGNTTVVCHTDNAYDIVGFGPTKSYMTQFGTRPQIKKNGKLQFYQNYPMNSGICSIFPIKDYNFDVLDQNSVFFVKNENNPTENVRVGGDPGEYSLAQNNVYGKAITESTKSEEFIADYCDKFKTYNVDSSSLGYMTLDSENDLGLFLSNMQQNGHNKFDISLLSPYCCKWRVLGTDMTGNRMRVMYCLKNDEKKVITYDSSTWIDGFVDPFNHTEIVPSDKHIMTPLIDISQDKDIYVNDSMKYCIDEVCYYYAAGTTPELEEFNRDFAQFNEELVKKCSYIRITIYKPDVIDYDDIYIEFSKKIGNEPYLIDDRDSYWIPNEDDDHIGYLSSSNIAFPNTKFSKYISHLYDEDETGYFNKYICTGEGSIDDLLYNVDNYDNKLSKIYKYGDNSIEFVSCGIKIRIKSTDKSTINLSRYVGYSAIAIAMSGNNANQPGTFELFIDETKEQLAFVIYNGIYSEYNRINYEHTNAGTYRTKHSGKLTDIEHYDSSVVLVEDDGFMSDCSTGLNDSKIFIISKPTNDRQEITNNRQIILTGNFVDIENGKIKLNGAQCAIDGVISNVDSQSKIQELTNANNNVDAYVITEQDSSVATHTLSVSELKKLTKSYAVSIKTNNGTKRHNDIASILSIDIVDPFEIKRENSNYDTVTSGYIHPSYAVPVMKDILKFNYKDENESALSDEFETSFDGCNIMISDVNKIKQTWMKKVIDINNVMKHERKEINKEITVPSVRYIIEYIPNEGEEYIKEITIGTNYKQKGVADASIFIVESFTPDYSTAESVTVNEYEIEPGELKVLPSIVFNTWSSGNHTILYTSDSSNNFEDISKLVFDNDSSTYNGKMILSNIGSGDEVLSVGEKMIYTENTESIIIGTINEIISNSTLIENLSPNYTLYGYIDDVITDNVEFKVIKIIQNENKKQLWLKTDSSINPSPDVLKNFYFIHNIGDDPILDSIMFDDDYDINFYNAESIYFTINSVSSTTETKYKSAYVQLMSNNTDAQLNSSTGTLECINALSDEPDIKYNVIKKSDTSQREESTISTYINQSSSVTLFRDQDPLMGYWYTDICRLFSKYDTYESYFGVFSGFEKNSYIASRGINLKAKTTNGGIIHGCIISTWVDSIVDTSEKSITLNITSSIINFINDVAKSGYSASWGKNQPYVTSMYDPYKTKYIENSILKLIDINNYTKFTLYVDNSVDELVFNESKPIDYTRFEEVKNLKNNLVFSENRYYMIIDDLDPHSYYAEITINF